MTYDVVDGEPSELLACLEAYPGASRVSESAWLIRSDTPAPELRDELAVHMGAQDRLFVGVLADEAAWLNPLCRQDRLLRCL